MSGPVVRATAVRLARRFLAAAPVAVAAVVGLLVAGAAAGGPPGPRAYRPPVAAPVVDPFRPPPEPWLPGNRGIEYATVPGTVVGAIGPGVVTFAGPVAGTLHVTVTHPDGLRSSSSYLAAVRVQVGARVDAGEAVGVAGARLHLGVRRGDTYLDPAGLWGRTVGGGSVALVPLDGGPGPRRAPGADHGGGGGPRPTAPGTGATAAVPGRPGPHGSQGWPMGQGRSSVRTAGAGLGAAGVRAFGAVHAPSLHSLVGPPPGGSVTHHIRPGPPTVAGTGSHRSGVRSPASSNRWERSGP